MGWILGFVLGVIVGALFTGASMISVGIKKMNEDETSPEWANLRDRIDRHNREQAERIARIRDLIARTNQLSKEAPKSTISKPFTGEQ